MKYVITLGEKQYEVEVERGEALLVSENTVAPVSQVSAVQSAAPAAQEAPKAALGAGDRVDSPMPGIVMSVPVSVGDTVKSGQVLAVIEAMKMENEITSLRDGKITGVMVSKGTAVETGTPLVTIA